MMVPSAAVLGVVDEGLVLDAVGDDERALPAGVAQLLDERRGLGRVATEEQRVGARARHLRDGGAEVGLLLLDRVVADDDCEPRSLRTMSARPLPYSDASSMTNAFVALRVSLMYLAAAGPCVASLPRARKKVFQPLSASFGLVADGVMVDEAGLVERRVGGLGLTGERGADDADDLLVVDGLLGQGRGLRRVTLRVVVLEGDLAVGVLLVVVVEGEVHAVLDVDAQVGVRAGEGTEHADLVVAAGCGATAGAPVSAVSPPLVPQAPRASAATASGTANLRVERTGVLLMSHIPRSRADWRLSRHPAPWSPETRDRVTVS